MFTQLQVFSFPLRFRFRFSRQHLAPPRRWNSTYIVTPSSDGKGARSTGHREALGPHAAAIGDTTALAARWPPLLALVRTRRPPPTLLCRLYQPTCMSCMSIRWFYPCSTKRAGSIWHVCRRRRRRRWRRRWLRRQQHRAAQIACAGRLRGWRRRSRRTQCSGSSVPSPGARPLLVSYCLAMP